MTDALIGFVGKDYVILAADRTASRSIVNFKHDEDKILQLDKNKLMAMAGPQGDRTAFGEYIQKNLHLYQFRTGLSLSTKAAASWTRTQLAEFLRSDPYQVDSLIAGFDTTLDKDAQGPQLFFMDYLASMHPVTKGCQGYVGHFLNAMLDRYWIKDLSEAEGIELIKKCIAEIHLRFFIAKPKFLVKIIDKNGIRIIDLDEKKSKDEEERKSG